MQKRLALIWETVKTSLWFVSGLMTIGAFGLAWGILQIPFPDGDFWWLHSGDAQDASEVLRNLLSSLINVAALAISITIVVLTLAAQQLGPRLIRSFMGDWRTQGAIGLFTGTMVYILLVLRGISDSMDTKDVPHYAVTFGTVMFVVCIFVLLLYINHLARSIIVDTVINRVGRNLDATIRSYTTEAGEDRSRTQPPSPEKAATFGFEQSGYVQTIDFGHLAKAAATADAQIELMVRPGHHLLRGGIHARVWPAGALSDALRLSLRNSVVIGDDRTSSEDIEYAVRLLVEIALRALSPGINDPFTAIVVINRLARSFAILLERDEPRRNWCDGQGQPRLWAPLSDFEGITGLAFNIIRQSARDQPAVLIHLLRTIGQLANKARTSEQRRVLTMQADMVVRAGRRSFQEEHDRAELERSRDVSFQSGGFRRNDRVSLRR